MENMLNLEQVLLFHPLVLPLANWHRANTITVLLRQLSRQFEKIRVPRGLADVSANTIFYLFF